MVSDNAGHTNIRLTDEAYCKGTAVNDFVEYKRDTFLVTILEASHFAIIKRPGGGGMFNSGKITKIRSMNSSYLSMGIDLIPGPKLEYAYALVRDRRGIQLVNLKLGTSHQLIMSPVPVQYTDIRFLKVIYDAKKHKTHLVTLYYGDYPESIKAGLDMSAQADREGNRPVLCIYSFNREFQSGLISMINNSTSERTLY